MAENGNFSLADLSAVLGNKENGGLGGVLLLVIVFLFVVMFMGRGGDRGPNPNYVTQAELTAGLNNLGAQQQLQQIALSSANNNYETARLIDNQTSLLTQQNNTNQINAIQGFNQVNLAIQNQTNVFSQLLQGLSAKLDSCCCEIKTQMLQNRLDDAERRNVAQQGIIDNANQSQYLLGQMGKWVANAAAAAT